MDDKLHDKFSDKTVENWKINFEISIVKELRAEGLLTTKELRRLTTEKKCRE